ncbi:claudin-1-like [Scleropages formosus]|uniref:Claudin n=1 Tax=Scleropages formosus TaxID=113540 RepID=A0A8C9W4K8_SCLFO|nr:claudin-1-like [Scleropages formosus]
MVNASMQLFGFVLAFVGFVALITSTSMTEWKASSFAGPSIVTAQSMYEGLWMSCVEQSTGQVQCKVFDSLLEQPAEMQVTRALMITSIFIAAVAAAASVAGMKCTTCLEGDERYKSKVALAGGAGFVMAGLCALVATSWYGNRITAQFHEPLAMAHRYEYGKALFLGWVASAVSVLGGLILCCNSVGRGPRQRGRYPQERSSGSPAMDYV